MVPEVTYYPLSTIRYVNLRQGCIFETGYYGLRPPPASVGGDYDDSDEILVSLVEESGAP